MLAYLRKGKNFAEHAARFGERAPQPPGAASARSQPFSPSSPPTLNTGQGEGAQARLYAAGRQLDISTRWLPTDRFTPVITTATG